MILEKRIYPFIFFLSGFVLLGHEPLLARVNVLTYHNDLARTGLNSNETILNPSNVKECSFGQIFANAVDGQIYAQPLYVSDLTISGQTHNVVYVATEHDGVYAFDADNAGVTLWYVNFTGVNSGVTVTSVPYADVNYCFHIVPEIGITDTPVIDLTTNTMYVEAMTREISAGPVTAYVHRLHALDILTGAEKFGGPVGIQALSPGTGDGGSTDSFVGQSYKERGALALANGVVYTSWSSHCDDTTWSNYHGWLLGYDAQTLAQKYVLNITPNGSEGALWNGGNGPAVDASGRLFLMTGNGSFDGAVSQDWGDSFLRVETLGGALTVTNSFTPFDQASLNSGDEDLGSGGLVLLPDSVGSAAHPHLMVGVDKRGKFYLVDRDNLGGYSGPNGPDNIIESFQMIHGGFSTPAYFNGRIYFGLVGANPVAYDISNGSTNGSPMVDSDFSFGYPGSTPSISCNGTSNGVVWFVNPIGSSNLQLIACDASNMTTLFLGPAIGYGKFDVPTVANGKVYVGGPATLTVYGLLPSTPTPSLIGTPIPIYTATPTGSPTYAPTQTPLPNSGMNWYSANNNAAFPGRYGHTSVVYNGLMWIIGGNTLDDVWSSPDGVNWTRATASAAFSGRWGHSSVVFNNKIWVIGGNDGTNPLNDVWSSTDGMNWTMATASASFPKRWGHTSLVYKNLMWVIGGISSNGCSGYDNDVWYSADGVNWSLAGYAPFGARSYHSSLVFNDLMWVIGGYEPVGSQGYKNDVWYSSDGASWTQATSSAGFSPRSDHSSLNYGVEMWVIGGDTFQGNLYTSLNDVWSSADGVNWTQETSSAQFTRRGFHSSVVFNNQIWVMGGTSTCCGTNKNDVWYSPLLPTPTWTPTFTATPTPTFTPCVNASGTPCTSTYTPSFTPTNSPTPTPSPTTTPILSGLGSWVLAPVPVKQGQNLCLYPDGPLRSSDWNFFDMVGDSLVHQNFTGSSQNCWTVSGLSPGLYLARIQLNYLDGSSKTGWQKIVVVP